MPKITRKTTDSRASEHEYEPIATPAQLLPVRITMKAPVVTITDADLVPVLDSDDSIEDTARFRGAITLDGDLILPLDGHLEDNVMEGKELRHDGDTPDEEDDETAEEFQKRLERQYFETLKSAEELRNNQVGWEPLRRSPWSVPPFFLFPLFVSGW